MEEKITDKEIKNFMKYLKKEFQKSVKEEKKREGIFFKLDYTSWIVGFKAGQKHTSKLYAPLLK